MSHVKASKTQRVLEEQKFLSPRVKKLIQHTLLGAMAVITMLSLLTYHHDDLSFIFDSNTYPVTKNLLGGLGAYWASFILYFFGCSAWLIPLALLYALRIELFGLAWKREYDRMIGLIVLVVLSSVTCNYYAFEWYRGTYPGGLCGSFLASVLWNWLEIPHPELLLFVVAWALLLIVIRFSFIVYLYPLQEMVAQIPFKAVYQKVTSSVTSWITSFFPQNRSELEQASFEEDTRFNQLAQDLQELQPQSSFKDEALPVTAANKTSLDSEEYEEDEPRNQVRTGSYQLPPVEKFFIVTKEHEVDTKHATQSKERALALEAKLERFGIKGKIVSITQGPVVTLFEYQPSIDTRINTIVAREDDLALALQALSLRILAPIPGRSVVGFEVAQTNRKPVLFSHIITNKSYTSFKGHLPLILGKDTLGAHIIIDLAATPHLLVAGSTGSGKSVGLHAMITSMLCAKTPDEVQLILIDPKRLEFAAYTDIPHLVFPVVTDPKRAILVLKWAVQTMEDRYAKLAEAGARSAADYNRTIDPTDEAYMPFLVIVIDELADLMMTAGKEVEMLIARLAQMARAAGIHMIVATQRPSVDVITGLIKVNFPSRIAYKVTSKVDSRTILDMTGAEKLLGKGDMLFLDTKGSVQRVHGAFVTEEEIAEVMNHIKSQRAVLYKDITPARKSEQSDEEADELFQDVVDYLKHKDEISISLLQRVFRVGYNRSARIIDQLEQQGHILPSDGGKMRKVIKEQ